MSKKPSSGVEIGLWVVGGLVGLYLAGAALIYMDIHIFGGRCTSVLPSIITEGLLWLYDPIISLLLQSYYHRP